jgi:hypothetical protein
VTTQASNAPPSFDFGAAVAKTDTKKVEASAPKTDVFTFGGAISGAKKDAPAAANPGGMFAFGAGGAGSKPVAATTASSNAAPAASSFSFGAPANKTVEPAKTGGFGFGSTVAPATTTGKHFSWLLKI